jgi:hypothetical protein
VGVREREREKLFCAFCRLTQRGFAAEDGTLTLVDWKRTDKNLSFAFNNAKCKGPLEGLDFMAHDKHKYSLQLNLYKHLLTSGYAIEDSHGKKIQVGTMLVVQLHPKLAKGVKVTQIQDLPEQVGCIVAWLKDRLHTLEAQGAGAEVQTVEGVVQQFVMTNMMQGSKEEAAGALDLCDTLALVILDFALFLSHSESFLEALRTPANTSCR